jgi:hypothetical protein
VLFLLGKRSLKVWAASQTLLACYSCRAAILTPPTTRPLLSSLKTSGSVRLRKRLAEDLTVASCLVRLRADPNLHLGPLDHGWP